MAPVLIGPLLIGPRETSDGETGVDIDLGAIYDAVGAAAGVEYRIDELPYALLPIADGGVVFGCGM